MAKRITAVPPTVPLELWRELYQSASCFQQLAPWQWMDDTHVFGVNNEHGLRLVTVLGSMGEVFGLASYRGSAGANFLMRLRSGEFDPESPEARFSQDALLVDFVPRNELQKEDRAITQQLDFQPAARKPKLFPTFQSHKPGYVPWFIDEGEAHLLLDDLRKAVRFAELLQTNFTIYDSRQENELPFFPVSISEPLTLAQLEWHTILPVPPSLDHPVDIHEFHLPALLAFPQPPKAVWELTAFYSPMPVGEAPRPYFPKMALAADAGTGIILGFHLAPSGYIMAQAAVRSLIECIKTAGCRPAAIRVDSLNLTQALQPVTEVLKIKLLQVKSLPMANEARRSLEAFGRQF
ncbi:MAG: hypothetical protein JWQ04_962 [Pedosphaera sp.]|nr:hypothetical protein [Pedosphaera sp.]